MYLLFEGKKEKKKIMTCCIQEKQLQRTCQRRLLKARTQERVSKLIFNLLDHMILFPNTHENG